jgi:hypothetical protein
MHGAVRCWIYNRLTFGYTETSKESHDGICIDYRPIDHNLFNDKYLPFNIRNHPRIF